MGKIATALAILLVLAPSARPQQPSSPLERYRNLEYPPTVENFDKGWKDRVALDFEIVNTADLKSLRAALKDKDTFVRAMAARALGIRADRESADALAELAKTDPDYIVRIRAVESLGFLKMKADVVEAAKKDKDLGVVWTANLAAEQFKSDTDYAAQLRQAFAEGIQREAMGAAKVGKPAPDFTALTTDGKTFKLSTVLGRKPIAIYFAAFDG
jgi:hypothetical protein